MCISRFLPFECICMQPRLSSCGLEAAGSRCGRTSLVSTGKFVAAVSFAEWVFLLITFPPATASGRRDGAEGESPAEAKLEEYIKTVQGKTGLHATHQRTVHM